MPESPESPNAAVDASRCPLCGQSNRCAMEVEKATGRPQPPCWCTQVDFARELLDQVPGPQRGLACICEACAARGGKPSGPSAGR